MTAKHTPGPWTVSGQRTKYVESRIRSGWVQEIAAVGPTEADNGYGPQQEANARLIAAAPELLDVVKGFRRKLETYVSVYPGDKELRRLLSNCDAAIAKATGEPA